MPTYIQLLTLTPEGRERTLRNPEHVLQAQQEVKVPGISVLGLYGVLGAWDFVNIVEAPDNDTVARFSIALGVRGGVTIVTLPAIPIGRLEEGNGGETRPEERISITMPLPTGREDIGGRRS